MLIRFRDVLVVLGCVAAAGAIVFGPVLLMTGCDPSFMATCFTVFPVAGVVVGYTSDVTSSAAPCALLRLSVANGSAYCSVPGPTADTWQLAITAAEALYPANVTVLNVLMDSARHDVCYWTDAYATRADVGLAVTLFAVIAVCYMVMYGYTRLWRQMRRRSAWSCTGNNIQMPSAPSKDDAAQEDGTEYHVMQG
jgi:hypothetical protein